MHHIFYKYIILCVLTIIIIERETFKKFLLYVIVSDILNIINIFAHPNCVNNYDYIVGCHDFVNHYQNIVDCSDGVNNYQNNVDCSDCVDKYQNNVDCSACVLENLWLLHSLREG